MRKTLLFVMSVLATVFVISCDKDNNGGGKGTTGGDYEFVLDESTVMDATVDWRADTLEIGYSITNPTATGIVVPSTEVDWLNFNTQTFGVVTVYVAENMDFEDRSATFTLLYEETSYTFTVTQSSRVWDIEAICTDVLGAYNYGPTYNNLGLWDVQINLATTSEYFQADEHYFLFYLTFPAPEDTEDMSIPEGTYNLSKEAYLVGETTLFYDKSRYNTYPDGTNITSKFFAEGARLVVTRDGDNYIIDFDGKTEDTDVSIHARYEGPMSMTRYF